MSFPIKPCGHRVIIKPDPLEEKTEGGILIAYQDKKRQESGQHTGVIVAIGPTAWKDFSDGDPWASIGDHIYFAKYGGYELEVAGEKYRVMNDEDVTAIISGEAAA